MSTIVIDKNTRTKLRNIGKKEQTYDEIINDLIKKHKKSSVDSGKSIEQKV
jgi:hypothetical protein